MKAKNDSLLLVPASINELALTFFGEPIVSAENWYLCRDSKTKVYKWVVNAICGFEEMVAAMPVIIADVTHKRPVEVIEIVGTEKAALEAVALDTEIILIDGLVHILFVDNDGRQYLG